MCHVITGRLVKRSFHCGCYSVQSGLGCIQVTLGEVETHNAEAPSWGAKRLFMWCASLLERNRKVCSFNSPYLPQMGWKTFLIKYWFSPRSYRLCSKQSRVECELLHVCVVHASASGSDVAMCHWDPSEAERSRFSLGSTQMKCLVSCNMEHSLLLYT